MKPKILSIKLGYNPNSSSIGMTLRIFIFNALAISLIFSYMGFLLKWKKKKPAEGSEN